MGQSFFDKLELMSRCLDDADFAVEMLEIFARQLPEQLQKLTSAMSAGQAQEAAKAAHAMKGTAGNLAAKRLHVAMAELEKTLRQDDLAMANQLLEVILREAKCALDDVPATVLSFKTV